MRTSINDTIAAISTPPGQGGIGIVRLSGENSLSIADKIFEPAKGGRLFIETSHKMHYGFIRSTGEKKIVDEVLLNVMRAPKTYTVEDMVEINCHGGIIPLKEVLQLCIDTGARLAAPGEFTKRAFLNGRIDLSQAEAVMDVITSETDTSRRIAVDQLRGVFSGEISDIRSKILDAVSLIELGIDFSQEDIVMPGVEEIKGRVKDISGSIKSLLKTSEKGLILREGASVVICGRPNVGKSSLMNALLKHDRVIVTPVAGTTRDIIEESIDIKGVKIRISDTAGIIETNDMVELEGIKRSKEKLSVSDIVIFMLDNSLPVSVRDEDIYNTINDKKIIIVVNKTDLKREIDIDRVRSLFNKEDIIEVSVGEKKGLELVEDAILNELFSGDISIPEGPVVTNMRHRNLLEESENSIARAIETYKEKFNAELIASDLNSASHLLGLIIGESVEDDVLDRIFSRFCIGK